MIVHVHVIVIVEVIDPVIVAALVDGNDSVIVIDHAWTRIQPADGSGR